MKTRIYLREELDTFDEVLQKFNELRAEIVAESEVIDNALTELSSRIAKLEKQVKELTPESSVSKKKAVKNTPSDKNKKK